MLAAWKEKCYWNLLQYFLNSMKNKITKPLVSSWHFCDSTWKCCIWENKKYFKSCHNKDKQKNCFIDQLYTGRNITNNVWHTQKFCPFSHIIEDWYIWILSQNGICVIDVLGLKNITGKQSSFAIVLRSDLDPVLLLNLPNYYLCTQDTIYVFHGNHKNHYP